MLFMYTDALLTEKDGTGIIDLYCNDNDKKQPRRQYKSGKRKYYIEHPFYEFLIHQIIFPVLFIFVVSTFGMRPVAHRSAHVQPVRYEASKSARKTANYTFNYITCIEKMQVPERKNRHTYFYFDVFRIFFLAAAQMRGSP